MTRDVSIAVVDYDMGNIQSIRNALKVVAKDVRIVSNSNQFAAPDAVVIPGVGSFSDGMENLRARGFVDPLTDLILNDDTPFLGVCLGMQFLCGSSTEGEGSHEGLGWIPGKVTRINPETDSFRVPHMGWNNTSVVTDANSVLFRDFQGSGTFYFVHSYHIDPDTTDHTLITATSRHGTDVTAAIRQDNIFGVQFHPEKSQGAGLKVLENFVAFANGGEGL